MLGLHCCVGFSLVAARRNYSLVSVSRQFPGSPSTVVVVHGLICSGAPLHVDLPGPGIEPLSPALAGSFLTTEPPGKPQILQLFYKLFCS